MHSVPIITFAQSGRVIELRSANELNVRFANEEEIREFSGQVHFVQPSQREGPVMVWCDRAIQFLKQNKIELYGNVRIVRDNVTITSQRGTYFGNDRRAKVTTEVQLHKGSLHLSALAGEYFADEKKARFEGDVVVLDSLSSTMSDVLTYFEEEDKSIAVGNVKVINTGNRTTIFGDSVLHYGNLNYSRVPKSPRFMRVDSSSTGNLDTLVVVGKVMEAFHDTVETFIVRESVSLARSDLAAQCGVLTYERSAQRMVLLDHPIIWYGDNQITGDTIIVHTDDNRLKSVYVKGRGMAISRPDPSYPTRFDQLTGRELELHFREEKLHQIIVNRNATSLYYLFDEGNPNGVNKSTGDRIVIDFDDGTIENIRVIGGVEGRYYPEQLIFRREELQNLEGFRWVAERPMRVYDTIIIQSQK